MLGCAGTRWRGPPSTRPPTRARSSAPAATRGCACLPPRLPACRCCVWPCRHASTLGCIGQTQAACRQKTAGCCSRLHRGPQTSHARCADTCHRAGGSGPHLAVQHALVLAQALPPSIKAQNRAPGGCEIRAAPDALCLSLPLVHAPALGSCDSALPAPKPPMNANGSIELGPPSPAPRTPAF